MSGILGVGISGLLTSQRALTTTSHNISNANTEGYTRQRVELSARVPSPAGRMFLGNGVQVDGIRRMYDEYVNFQLRNATTSHSNVKEFQRLANQVDSLLADPNAGLAPALQGFFQAVHNVANDPASITARQVLLGQAQSLADRFEYLDQRFVDLNRGINAQITASVTDINNLSSGIAELNRQISLSRGAAGTLPNDLLDKRDLMIMQLAERVSVSTLAQDDGSINVFIGNGQTLVIGSTASTLAATLNLYDATRNEIGIVIGGNTTVISSQITGGSLGAALNFRNQMLDPSQNTLGRLANVVAETFNDQHRLGMDLYGSLGGDFFSITPPNVLAARTNGGAGTVGVTVSNATALTTSDYRVTYNGPGSWTVMRLSDNTSTTGAGPFTVDGLTFTVGGAPNVGDSYFVQPNQVASGLGVAISDARRIAAAGPVRTAEATDASGTPTNLGTGRISAGEVSTATGLPLAGAITLTFDPNAGGAGVPGFTVAGGPAGPLLYDPTTEYGGKQFTLTGYGDFTFTVSGAPQASDSFVISNNTSGVGAGDNRNGRALAGLQTRSLLNGATYEGAYGQLVAEVGSQTHTAGVQRVAQESLLNQTREAREALSGVNLDEEAANVLRYQQVYQAAAQVIAVADTLFQELIGAVRR